MSHLEIAQIRTVVTRCCKVEQRVQLGCYDTCNCCKRIFHLTWAGTIRMKHTNSAIACQHRPNPQEVK